MQEKDVRTLRRRGEKKKVGTNIEKINSETLMDDCRYRIQAEEEE